MTEQWLDNDTTKPFVLVLTQRRGKDTAELYVHECHFALLIKNEGLKPLNPRAAGLHMNFCTRLKIHSSTSPHIAQHPALYDILAATGCVQ